MYKRKDQLDLFTSGSQAQFGALQEEESLVQVKWNRVFCMTMVFYG